MPSHKVSVIVDSGCRSTLVGRKPHIMPHIGLSPTGSPKMKPTSFDMNDLDQLPSIRETPRARSALEVLTEIESQYPEFVRGKQYTSATVGAAYAARFVREMREAAGLTQEQLAHGIGQTQSSISDIERARGKLGPSFGLLCAIADECGMTITFQHREGKIHTNGHS